MKEDRLEVPAELKPSLSMKREKPFSIATSIAYRVTALGKKIIGRERLLPFFLNNSRLFWRFAHEISGELYGASYHTRVRALSEDLLKEWIPKDGTVIDIGCGIGRWCQVAAKYARRVIGVDYDKEWIRIARETTTAKNVEYILGDATKELKGEKFDLALLSHVIEHIDDSDKMLQEAKEFAKTLCVEVPDFTADPLNWVRLKHGYQFYSDGDHVREYTLETLQNQLEENGWKILQHEKNNGSMVVFAAQSEK
jgi:SAM-dependent methyltransferase